MKRFSYILAALLAGGATTALTSCIDTTEPAGITELRGAKAMLLKAKAAFIDAKTQREAVYLEQDKVQLESQKVDLELKKLNLELQKTLNAIKNDSANMAHKLYLETIQKKRDSLALRAEQDWWKVQKDITTAEKNYKKAIVDLQVALLTYKDEAIATKIEAYTKELYGESWSSTTLGGGTNILTGGLYGLLNQANLDLLEAQREKVLFTAKTDDYLNSLNLTKTKEENILKIQQDLLARMKELSEKFAQDSLQAVKESIIEIDDAIAKLDKKKLDLYNEIQNMKQTELASVSEKLAEYDAILNKDTAFVMDIVDEKLQDDLGQQLHLDPDYEDAFEIVDGKYVMKAAIEIKEDASGDDLTLRNMKNLPAVVGASGILNTIQSIYQEQYKTAYDLYVGGSSASDLFEADGKTVKGVYAAQLKNELERLELDQDELRQDCKDAQDKWLKTYETLSKALDAYKGYKDPSAKYKAAKEAIDKYLEATDGLSATGTADEKAKYLELSKKLRDQLVKDYYTYREPIDSVSSNYVNNFKKNYIDKDAAGKDQLTEANMTAFRDEFVGWSGNVDYSILGAQGFNSTSAVEGSALDEFLKAEGELFRSSGSTASSLAEALQPEKVDGKFVAPAGINAESYIADGSIYGSKINANSKFYKAAKTYEKNRPVILTTLADWVSLYDKIDGQMDQVADRVDGLIAAKKALVNANKDAYTAIWEKEVECYLIDGKLYMPDSDGSDDTSKPVLSDDNPYYVNYIGKTDGAYDDDDLMEVVKPTVTEKGVLEDEKALLEALIKTETGTNGEVVYTNRISYVVYDETTGKYITKEGRWEELIAAQEKVVEDAQEDVDNVQQRIDLLTKLGYMESSKVGDSATDDVTIPSTVGNDDQYIELLDKKIEQAQDKVNVLQAEFDRIQAKIQDLIKAAEDADFGSSDATYPGFGVDNDPIEVPGTEDPEPENPEPENPEPENPEPENPEPENPEPENPQPENPDTDKPAE